MHTQTHHLQLSRRFFLRSLAAFMLTMSIDGCAQSVPSSSATLPTPTPTPRRPGSVILAFRGHKQRVTAVAWSPDGRYIASGSLDETVQVWAANPGEHFHPFIYRGHNAGVNTLDWSPDSQRVVSGASDRTVQIWNALTGEHVIICRGHTDAVTTVAWSPDGKDIASGSADGTLRLWEAATGKVAYIYDGYNVKAAQTNPSLGVLPDLIFVVAWSHNGKRIAAVTQVYCGDNCAVIVSWDADTERNFTFYVDDPVFALAWSPDDTRFVTATDVTNQGTETRGESDPEAGPYAQISQA